MSQNNPNVRVDANKVAAILREQLAEANYHNAVLTVALEDAQARIANLSVVIANAQAEKEAAQCTEKAEDQ